MNRLDRAISWVAPTLGLRRQAARNQLALMQSYDGARTGRRTDGWTTNGTSANAEILAANQRLTSRSRDLVRNDPLFISAKRTIRLYAVGTGIELQLGDPKWQALWDEWSGESDAMGQLDFYGMQALAAGTIFESGSVLARRRVRLDSDQLTVPLQIQMMEPDHLDIAKDGSFDDGTAVVAGIKFDPISRRLGYWLYPVHPGETNSKMWTRGASQASVLVPAESVSHAYVMDRPGQVTGVPWAHSVILKAHDLAEYEEAELFRKKIEACNVGAVTQAGGILGNPLAPVAPNAPSGSGPGQQGGSPRPEQFEPGMFFYFGPGQEVKFNDPQGNTSYAAYTRTHQQSIGAGIGVPYDKLTGDLTQANYSSLKAGSNQFEALMDSFRWLCVIPQVCEPVLQWFIQAAVVSGRAPNKKLTEYEWQPPPYPEVDPLKEASARQLDVRSGVMTMQEVIRSRGGDPTRHLDAIEEWNAELDKRGIVLDTDPRRVTSQGMGQNVDPMDPGGNNSGSNNQAG